MTVTITERVTLGAKFLDEHDPEWWRADVERAIDLEKLALDDTGLCVLGQRCPLEVLRGFVGPEALADWGADAFEKSRYFAALRDLLDFFDEDYAAEWAHERGFADIGSDMAYDVLTDEWKRLIEARRSA